MRSRSRTTTVLATNPNADLYGASRMLLESVDGFVARGWRVVVCIPDGPLVDLITARGAEVRSVPSPVLRRTMLHPRGMIAMIALTLRSIPLTIRLMREVRPDVMYVGTIIQPLWIALGRILRIPIVCHVHEAEGTAPVLVRKTLAFPLLFTQRLVVNSRFSTKVLTDEWPSLASRCEVVYNGVAGPPTVTEPRPELDGPIRLLYVGRLSERKGVQDAVDAVAILTERGVDVHLDIVGDVFPGYEWMIEDLEARRARTGTTDRVHLLGFDSDIWPHLAEADILIIPSRLDEPFGNVAVEGALAARPMVVSATSGLLEAAAGFSAVHSVPPAEPAAIADAIEQVADRWGEHRTAAIADSVDAARRYSLERYRADLDAIIESV
ncbi:MAG TPA: glycosyltransferase family 4 protein [Acidimicrobiia bacterium]|jgi:glycosyltransferase involved in cell wall biosynthesis